MAIISPSTTGLNAASVAKVMASSTPLMRSTAARSTTSTPALAANRLARPVKARSTLTPSPATACAMLAAATSSDTSPSSSRTTTISLTPARVSASTSAGPIVVPFFSTSDPCRRVWTVTPPIASAGAGGTEFHAARSLGSRSCAVISAMIATAISDGDTAPMASPIGA